MFAALSDPAGIAYTMVFLVSGLVALVLIPRARAFDDPEVRWGLIGLLATTGAWGLLKTAYLLLPAPFREPLYTLGLVAGFGTVWSWLYFSSAYTGRTLHHDRTLRRLSAAVFVTVASVKLTNPIHGQYFTVSEATSPFPHLAIEHGIFHWSATGLSYVLASVGLFMLLELYVRSEYDARPLAVLAVLLGLPVVFDIVAVSTPGLIDFIYAPIGVAIFAVGVLFTFQERLLAVRTAVPGRGPSVYLDGDGRIRDTTPAARALFPALEDATGEPLTEVVPDVASVLDSSDAIFERGGDDPQYYLVEDNPIGLADSGATVITFTDVTRLERKRRQLRRREHELDEQNELYRAILAASFAFVYRVDPEGRLTFVSSPVEDTLGYAPDEIVGKPVDALAANDDSSHQAREYVENVLDGDAIYIQDFPLEHRDGRDVYVDVRVVPIFEPGVAESERTPENVVGAQGMVRETTDRRQREGLISVINRVLRHNVRNKLTVINGHAEMLVTDLDGQAAASADQILETADRLLDLTESAREIERVRDQSTELASQDLVPILTDVARRTEHEYPAATIDIDAPESAVGLTLPRIETAFSELLENAAKHGGKAPSVEVDVTVDAEGITVRIADDGPGLPDVEREALASGAEDPLAHGNGLGLWLAYWIATSLEARLEVVDTEQGTTVELVFPRPDA